ncbi:MAG: cytochrome oxidase small assembly protein [Burkholderiales bacterium]|nr:cytochrome oxidase small assembly protein [Burkholderiales bacterium]
MTKLTTQVNNKRLAYILFSIALVFFLGIVLKRVVLA